ncbi:transmembrane Fragile-X-F family protein [Yersinia massiliensis]|uniref:Transmembrane Fragile-X-F family protein n=1 Tax=Yersinia massiliensis TaxID=419257 RepID=A0AA91B817_9GAMM|nr:transmembrane Fragile-X-F family protein [Yersinia massiliensis]NIL27697.1 transmembrane Fragile-X-F family protein [Yersinia massiliensis]
MKFTPINFFPTVLALIFITLKLTGTLSSWSWWAVTSPLWALPAVIILIGALFFVLSVVVQVLAKIVK